MIAKVYMGAGPAHLDDEVIKGENYFTHELQGQLQELVRTLSEHANLYRRLPREGDGGDRT